MDGESPIIQLVNAVLLSALKKTARTIIVRPGYIELVVGDKLEVEMQPPQELHAKLVRRIGVMAEVPNYSTGEYACGRIELEVGDRPEHAYFDVTIRGHGDAMRAQLAVHGFLGRPPPFTPPGIPLDELGALTR